MEIVITLERDPDSPTVAIYSGEPAIYVIREQSATNSELLAAYADALEAHTSVSA